MRESRRVGSLLLRTQSDARLLRIFKEGDEAAFEELVRRYRAPLVAYAARIAGASNADDVVQESLTAAYRSLSEQEIRELRAWLYTVVRNRSFNHIAARPRGIEPLREEIFAIEDPVHAVEQRAALAALIEKVRALPVRQRRALVKHELEGLDYRRVASDLNLTIEAAKQLVYRARCRLRDAAGVLVPSGLLHSLAGEAASGPALLVKGGVAAGVLAGAVFVGMAPQSGTTSHERRAAAAAAAAKPRHRVAHHMLVAGTSPAPAAAPRGAAEVRVVPALAAGGTSTPKLVPAVVVRRAPAPQRAAAPDSPPPTSTDRRQHAGTPSPPAGPAPDRGAAADKPSARVCGTNSPGPDTHGSGGPQGGTGHDQSSAPPA